MPKTLALRLKTVDELSTLVKINQIPSLRKLSILISKNDKNQPPKENSANTFAGQLSIFLAGFPNIVDLTLLLESRSQQSFDPLILFQPRNSIYYLL